MVGFLLLQFAYQLLNSLVQNMNVILNRLAGELVVNHIKLKIMNKAKDVDLASFDMPGFYEKLENANREAVRTIPASGIIGPSGPGASVKFQMVKCPAV